MSASVSRHNTPINDGSRSSKGAGVNKNASVAEQPGGARGLVNLEWAIEHHCGDPLRRGGSTAYYGPSEPRQPSIDDFVDTDGCERERRRSEDFCDSEFKAQVQAACGVTFD